MQTQRTKESTIKASQAQIALRMTNCEQTRNAITKSIAEPTSKVADKAKVDQTYDFVGIAG